MVNIYSANGDIHLNLPGQIHITSLCMHILMWSYCLVSENESMFIQDNSYLCVELMLLVRDKIKKVYHGLLEWIITICCTTHKKYSGNNDI